MDKELIKSLKGKHMKKDKKKIPKKERFVRLFIHWFLPHHHLSRNPIKKIKEEKCLCDEPFGNGRIDNSHCPIHKNWSIHHPSGESPALGEADV